jgi:DNA-binding transcriptional LysR family regulator
LEDICVMSADHPLAKRKRLTLDEYLRCSHLVIDIIDGEQPLIANRLRELGVARRAALTVPLNAGAAAVLPGTNLVATMNTRLVDRYADDRALAVVAAPVELEPFHYLMVCANWTLRSQAAAAENCCAMHASSNASVPLRVMLHPVPVSTDCDLQRLRAVAG